MTTDHQFTPMSWVPDDRPPVQRKRHWPWIVTILAVGLIAVALVLTTGRGESGTATIAAGSGHAATTAAVPQECLDALDDADALIAYVGDGMDLVSRAMDAEDSGDYLTLGRLSDEMEALTPQIKTARQQYNTDSALCRAG